MYALHSTHKTNINYTVYITLLGNDSGVRKYKWTIKIFKFNASLRIWLASENICYRIPKSAFRSFYNTKPL